MQRNVKTYIFSFLGIIISIFIICQTLSYYNFFRNDLIIINKTVYSNLLPENSFKSHYTAKIKFADRPVTKVNDVSLNILNETNITNVPMLLKAQRYYIPINFISKKLNYTIDTSDGSISLSNNDTKIEITEHSYTKNSETGSLRGNLINNNGTNYISISDIEELFNLIAIFDFKNKNISLLPSNVKAPDDSSVLYTDKIALIRFEDFACGYTNTVDKNQTKVKCMADLLYSQGMKFHVGWIPRFVSPPDNIDNDLLTNDNITNVGFVNVLDYILNKGGEIGLHGYTHQHANEISGSGEEMSKDVNNTIPETKAIIENGIDTASALNIPISFYESPHYRESELQRNVIADYFQFIYEPYDYSHKNIYSPDDYHLYVPAPLGRVHDLDTSDIINGLNDDNPDVLNSFYYHPSIEIDYINFNTIGNKLNVTFDPKSPLQQIVKTLKSDEYTTVHIDELKDK